jgi:hypothetical protein
VEHPAWSVVTHRKRGVHADGRCLFPFHLDRSRQLDGSTRLPFRRFVFTHSCGDADPKAYASLLDPTSAERNFGVTGRTGWLYYTQLNYRDCRMTLDRDLVRIPVEITTTPLE